jgi:hypothetical protein
LLTAYVSLHSQHFWLNEGLTVFLERKIIRALHGPAQQHLHAIIGWNALRSNVEDHFKNGPYTAMVPDLTGVDPVSSGVAQPCFHWSPCCADGTGVWCLVRSIAAAAAG